MQTVGQNAIAVISQ